MTNAYPTLRIMLTPHGLELPPDPPAALEASEKVLWGALRWDADVRAETVLVLARGAGRRARSDALAVGATPDEAKRAADRAYQSARWLDPVYASRFQARNAEGVCRSCDSPVWQPGATLCRLHVLLRAVAEHNRESAGRGQLDPAVQWMQLVLGGFTCESCGRSEAENYERWGEPLHIDHRHPSHAGGPNTDENTGHLCTPCHAAKTVRDREATVLERRLGVIHVAPSIDAPRPNTRQAILFAKTLGARPELIALAIGMVSSRLAAVLGAAGRVRASSRPPVPEEVEEDPPTPRTAAKASHKRK